MKGELTRNPLTPKIHRVLEARGFVLPISAAFCLRKMKRLFICSVVSNHGQSPCGLLRLFPNQMPPWIRTVVGHGLPGSPVQSSPWQPAGLTGLHSLSAVPHSHLRAVVSPSAEQLVSVLGGSCYNQTYGITFCLWCRER